LAVVCGPTWRASATDLAIWAAVAAIWVGFVWTQSASNTNRFGRRERWFAWAFAGLFALRAVGRWVGDLPPPSR
jgi:hypothetical protein